LGGGTPVSSAAAKAFSFQSVAPTPLGSPITVIDLSSNAPTACFTTHSRTVMDYFRRFTFLFAAPVFDTDDLEGLRFNQIITEMEKQPRGLADRARPAAPNARLD
jgi:hypothetical protein